MGYLKLIVICRWYWFWMTSVLTKASFHLDAIFPITFAGRWNKKRCWWMQRANREWSFFLCISFLRLFLRPIVCFKHQRFFLGLQWQFWDRKYRTSTNRIVRSMSLPFSCIYFPRAFTYANVACHECHSAWQSTFGKVAVPVARSLFFFF